MNTLAEMDKDVIHQKVWREPNYFFAFGFGSGLLPGMPGTFGTLVAIPLYLLLQHVGVPAYALVTALMFVFGVYCCDVVVKEIGIDDYSGIVWDEIVGYLVTMIAAPSGWLWVIAGFILFRLFDILKPWPINWVDRWLSNGLGIMLDDVIAGAYAFLGLLLLHLLI